MLKHMRCIYTMKFIVILTKKFKFQLDFSKKTLLLVVTYPKLVIMFFPTFLK